LDCGGPFTGKPGRFVRVPLAVTSSAGFYLGTTVFGNSESRCLTAVSKEIATGVAASGAAAMDVCDSASNAQVWELVRTRDGEPAADTDKDGLTDVEEQALGTDFLNPDTDQDGIFDAEDSTQLSDPKADTDGDGISDADDSDDDNDGVDDTDDAFPLDATESEDTDNDGKGNNADDDDDNDGVLDADDSFGLAPANVDTDGDGVIDSKDALPLISLAGLVDTDGDGLPDACDAACVARGLRADTLDSRGPVISLTTPLQIDAIGPLTRLSPTAATATDATDDSVRLVATPRGPYISGRHVITWIASDSDGNVTTREQVLEIKPWSCCSQTNGLQKVQS